MKNLLRSILSFLVAASFFSCAKDNPVQLDERLFNRWNLQILDGETVDISAESTATFTANGEFVLTGIIGNYEGSYRVVDERKIVCLTQDNMSFEIYNIRVLTVGDEIRLELVILDRDCKMDCEFIRD